MPTDIQQRVSKDVQAIAADPAFRARLEAAGTVARIGTSSEFAAAIEEQRVKIAAIHHAIAKPVP
jgi:tripartite-type tricarboxylate transporter receptor subunit TctC